MEKMEKEEVAAAAAAATQKRHQCRATVLNLISSFCSVASIAFCVLLSVNNADIRSRVVDLESGNSEPTFTRAPGYSLDDMNSLIEERVEKLLSQVPALALID